MQVRRAHETVETVSSRGRSEDQPLVSVVTPVYNGAAYLGECVESILRQTYTNFEYTIVDNASTDETSDLADRFAAQDSRIRHLRFEELVESNENHNRAFRAIGPESEYCKVVQADDWLYPDCLERMVAVAQSAGDVAFVARSGSGTPKSISTAFRLGEPCSPGERFCGRLCSGRCT